MFYDINLLCPKKRGKFATVWLVATRGIKTVPSERLKQVNIPHVCNEILEMIMSNSGAPKNRLSLKLASQLTFGTVCIYRQHVITFERQILNFCFYIRRPISLKLNELEDEDQPPKKKIKKTPKSKKDETLAKPSAQEIQNVPEMVPPPPPPVPIANPNAIDSMYITMPEETTIAMRRDYDPFGDEGQMEIQVALLNDATAWTNTAQIPDPSTLQPAQAMDELMFEPMLVDAVIKEMMPDKPREPELEKTQVDMISGAAGYPHVLVRQFGSISPEDRMQNQACKETEQVTTVQAEPPAESEIQVQAPTDSNQQQELSTGQAQQTKAKSKRRIRSAITDDERHRRLIYVDFGPYKRVNINRRRSKSPEIFKRPRSFSLCGPASEKNNARLEIVEKIFERLENSDINSISVLIEEFERNQSSSIDSAPRLAGVDNSTSHLSRIVEKDSIQVSEIQGPQQVHTIDENAPELETVTEMIPLVGPQPIEPNLTEPQPVVTNKEKESISSKVHSGDEFDTPRAKRRKTFRMSHIEEDISPVRREIRAELIEQIIPDEIVHVEHPPALRIHTSTPMKNSTSRYTNLIRIMKKLFDEGKSALKIEDVCFRIDRLHVATVFGDLLYLHSKKYVILQSKLNSVELDVILRGTRM